MYRLFQISGPQVQLIIFRWSLLMSIQKTRSDRSGSPLKKTFDLHRAGTKVNRTKLLITMALFPVERKSIYSTILFHDSQTAS